MLGIIKTAIITITLSFISGVLLDRYKNVAPKILCNMKESSRSKGLKIYDLRIKNTSKKTIHNLNVNLQSKLKDLEIDDANITNGLKFEITSEDNNYNVSIPFLSKDDEFSVKLIIHANKEDKNKPMVSLRSPENFKKISTNGDKKVLDVLQNFKAIFLDKRVIAIAVAIFLVCGGITMSKYFLKEDSKQESTGNEESKDKVDSSKDTGNTVKNSSPSNDKSKNKTDNSNNKENNKAKNSTSNTSNNTKSSSSEKNTSENSTTENKNETNVENNNSSKENKNTDNEKNSKSNESKETNSAPSKEGSKQGSEGTGSNMINENK